MRKTLLAVLGVFLLFLCSTAWALSITDVKVSTEADVPNSAKNAMVGEWDTLYFQVTFSKKVKPEHYVMACLEAWKEDAQNREETPELDQNRLYCFEPVTGKEGETVSFKKRLSLNDKKHALDLVPPFAEEGSKRDCETKDCEFTVLVSVGKDAGDPEDFKRWGITYSGKQKYGYFHAFMMREDYPTALEDEKERFGVVGAEAYAGLTERRYREGDYRESIKAAFKVLEKLSEEAKKEKELQGFRDKPTAGKTLLINKAFYYQAKSMLALDFYKKYREAALKLVQAPLIHSSYFKDGGIEGFSSEHVQRIEEILLQTRERSVPSYEETNSWLEEWKKFTTLDVDEMLQWYGMSPLDFSIAYIVSMQQPIRIEKVCASWFAFELRVPAFFPLVLPPDQLPASEETDLVLTIADVSEESAAFELIAIQKEEEKTICGSYDPSCVLVELDSILFGCGRNHTGLVALLGRKKAGNEKSFVYLAVNIEDRGPSVWGYLRLRHKKEEERKEREFKREYLEKSEEAAKGCASLVENGEHGDKIDIVIVPSISKDFEGFEELEYYRSAKAQVETFERAMGEDRMRAFNFYFTNIRVPCFRTEDGYIRCNFREINQKCPFADHKSVSYYASSSGKDWLRGFEQNGNIYVLVQRGFASSRTFVHELGHAIFDFADKYCCHGGYWDATNLFSTKARCTRVSERLQLPLPEYECERLALREVVAFNERVIETTAKPWYLFKAGSVMGQGFLADEFSLEELHAIDEELERYNS